MTFCISKSFSIPTIILCVGISLAIMIEFRNTKKLSFAWCEESGCIGVPYYYSCRTTEGRVDVSTDSMLAFDRVKLQALRATLPDCSDITPRNPPQVWIEFREKCLAYRCEYKSSELREKERLKKNDPSCWIRLGDTIECTDYIVEHWIPSDPVCGWHRTGWCGYVDLDIGAAPGERNTPLYVKGASTVTVGCTNCSAVLTTIEEEEFISALYKQFYQSKQ